MRRKAREGVKVEILVDGWGTKDEDWDFDAIRADGVDIVPNDDPKIMQFLTDLWATGDTQKITDGVLAAEFIWQENLNKIPGLNALLKQFLDLIQAKGMLEAVKTIL